MVTRREALLTSMVAGGTALLVARQGAAAQSASTQRGWERSYSGTSGRDGAKPGLPGVDYQPVITPNGATLPFKIVDGVKVFHLIAEPVEHEFAPGLTASCWGYNGRVHGPTIEAVEGDRVRIYVSNRLAAPTSVHWHAVFLPNGMDGVAGLNQRAIRQGETFKYELTLRQHGTFMYHAHHDEMTQMAMGMMGMLVVHPRKPTADYRVDRDFVILLSEWRIEPGTSRPDPNAMSDFNVLTMNARAFPGTEPLVCKTGDRVRVRLGNLSAMDHHPVHLHGHYFKVTATDGGSLPVSAQWPETTVLVPVGSTRDIELVADAPGDWAFHCHMTHHVMNQMGHGLPNMTGVNHRPLDERVRPLLPGYTGYEDVRELVSRTGHDVRWQHLEPSEAWSKEARSILAAPLTEKSAIRFALLQNHELQAAFEQLGMARGDLVRTLRLPNPSAEAGLKFEPEGSPGVELSLTQDLAELILLPMRGKAAHAEFSAAKVAVAGRAMDLIFEVRKAFSNYVADQQILELRKTVLAALAAAATAAEEIHRAGNMSDLALANERVLHEEARVSFSSAATALATSRERLNALLGVTGKDTSWEANERLRDPEDLPRDELESAAIARRLSCSSTP